MKEFFQLRKELINLVFFKFFFVGLISEILFFCVMIVFCYNSLFFYCLRILKRMLDIFKDSFFFCVVCCNGVIDMFYMFQKDDVLEYLIKKWIYFYLIYIVLMFYNYEILYVLIQFGVDVNCRMVCGWIVLMLVVENNIKNSKVKNLERLCNIR